MIQQLASGPLQTQFGEWTQHILWDGNAQIAALSYGRVERGKEIYCRIHSSCITAHVFYSTECDCREQMGIAMAMIQERGSGVVIWLDQEGRANGMVAHTLSQQLKRDGMGQSEAYEALGYPRDPRDYRGAASTLRELGVESVVIITNNPDKIGALAEAGVPVLVGDERAVIAPDNDILWRQYRDKIADGHLIVSDSHLAVEQEDER